MARELRKGENTRDIGFAALPILKRVLMSHTANRNQTKSAQQPKRQRIGSDRKCEELKRPHLSVCH